MFILSIKAANTSTETVPYQCQYFTINSSISECYHKCGTQNAELEIVTNESSQTHQNPRVDG